jgi:RNA polymerase sigma-B factor
VRRRATQLPPGVTRQAMAGSAIRRVVPERGTPEGAKEIDARTADLFRALSQSRDDAERDRLRQEIAVLNLPMARRVAAHYAGRGEVFDDLFQVACVALVKTVRTFDVDAGIEFACYATPSMHGEVKRHFRDHTWGIRPPRHIQDSRKGVSEAVQLLTQELRRAPRLAEIVEATGLDAHTVDQCLASDDLYRLASIDAIPVGGTSDSGSCGVVRGSDFAPSLARTDDRLELIEDRIRLRPLIVRLSPRERRLLALRFVDDLTQEQIAREFGISQVQVSRLLTKVLAGLREGLAAA